MSAENPFSQEPLLESEPDQIFNLTNKEGKIIGTAHVKLEGPERTPEGLGIDRANFAAVNNGPYHLKKVTSFVIRGPKGSYDVLKNIKGKGCSVYVASTNLVNYCFGSKKDDEFAIIPPFQDEINLGIALHELGHSQQKDDPKFRKISEIIQFETISFWGQLIKENSKSSSASLADQALKICIDIAVSIPEAHRDFLIDPRESIQKLGRVEKKYKDSIAACEKELNGILTKRYQEIIKLQEDDTVPHVFDQCLAIYNRPCDSPDQDAFRKDEDSKRI